MEVRRSRCCTLLAWQAVYLLIFMIKDKVFKRLLIPIFGILIPLAAGLVNLHQLGFLQFVLSIGFFIFLSYVTWQGAVKIFCSLRHTKQCKKNIFRKLIILSFSTALYGVCVIFIFSGFWQVLVFKTIILLPIIKATTITAVAVIILTLIYEAVFLSAEVDLDSKVLQQLDNERLQAEINVLQNELEPHFLFNCLNALSYLVCNDQEKAYQFIHKLSNVFKYFLINKQKDFVPLVEEINFLEDYYYLLRVRFDDGVQIKNEIDASETRAQILPCTLQALVENAIKHNFFSDKEPLLISIRMSSQYITVSNPVKPKLHVAADSTRTGLNNLKTRYRLIMNKDVVIDLANNMFLVKIPMLK
jgi:sensor histidine kinase YesM